MVLKWVSVAESELIFFSTSDVLSFVLGGIFKKFPHARISSAMDSVTI